MRVALGDPQTGDIIAFGGDAGSDNPMHFNDIISHDVKVGFRWSFDQPDYYDGVLWRRSIAFCIDGCLMLAVIILLLLFNLFTLFIFAGPIFALIAAPLFVLYDTLTVGGSPSATLGMRLKLEALDQRTGLRVGHGPY